MDRSPQRPGPILPSIFPPPADWKRHPRNRSDAGGGSTGDRHECAAWSLWQHGLPGR